MEADFHAPHVSVVTYLDSVVKGGVLLRTIIKVRTETIGNDVQFMNLSSLQTESCVR